MSFFGIWSLLDIQSPRKQCDLQNLQIWGTASYGPQPACVFLRGYEHTFECSEVKYHQS